MEDKMMVMRRALRDVSRVAEEMTRGTMTGESVDRKTVDAWALRLCEITSRDLATPLRNCEVGTPKEKMRRFIRFCRCDCKACPIGKTDKLCLDEWLQMPYEDGGAK